ncbi:helix-turn-helix transcriptional regulator [Polaromonas sp.]|uniref:helix-turn-helix transcriptional regulator n=1 Tax=Polaromonas sp. TaxID=1869339 RepID=UPI003BA97E4A
MKSNHDNNSTGTRYMRAKAASAYFQIAKSTLWLWVKTREGFPQPIKAGSKVTLFDVDAIERYIGSSERG